MDLKSKELGFLLENDLYPSKKEDRVLIIHDSKPDGTLSAAIVMKNHNGFCDDLLTCKRELFLNRFRDKLETMAIPNGSKLYLVIVDWYYPIDELRSVWVEQGRNVNDLRIAAIDHHKDTINKFTSLFGDGTVVDEYEYGRMVYPVDRNCALYFGTRYSAAMYVAIIHGYVPVVGYSHFGIIDLISDHDTWSMWHPDTQAFIMGLEFLHDREVIIDHLIKLLDKFTPEDMAKYVEIGEAILSREERKFDKLNDNLVCYDTDFGKAAVLNKSGFINTMCARIYLANPDVDFVMCVHSYDLENDSFVINIRSDKNKKGDFTKLAEQYGGGGHPTSCGMTMTPTQLREFLKV